MERFNLKELNDMEVKEQYQVKISNRFAALKNLDDNVDFTRAWESMRENIKASATECLGYCGLKQHKPWFDEKCSKLLDPTKRGKVVAQSKPVKWRYSEQNKT
jgi:hypothetical protein